MNTKLIPIKEIQIKSACYPRSSINGVYPTIVGYYTAMKAGSIFPPIVVAQQGNNFLLVDGLHRLKAYLMNKQTHVLAEVLTGITEEQVYVEAVKLNASHGMGLTYYDKLSAVRKLMKMGLSQKIISSIVHIPADELSKNIAKRLVITSTGEELIGKKGLMNHSTIPMDLATAEKGNVLLNSGSQEQLLEQLIFLIENQLIDLKKPRVKSLYAKLCRLIVPKNLEVVA